MNLDNLTVNVNKMKKMINSVAIACLFLVPTFSMAEHIVFGPIITERSRIMITIELIGKDKLKLEAVVGDMAGKIIEKKCQVTDKTMPIEKLLPSIAKHLNEAKMTSLSEIASEVGLSECK